MKDAKFKAIVALSGPKRYSHFIKVVADQNCAWGLYGDGWALCESDSDDETALPLWPAKDFALACAEGTWIDLEPRKIELRELLDVVLPELRERGEVIAVFPTPSGSGVIPTLDQLEIDLRSELSRIE